MSYQRGRSLRYSSYITAHAVIKHFVGQADRSDAVDRLRYMGMDKAYVEVYRSGLFVDEGALESVRDFLREEGFEVSGGIATTHGANFTDRSTAGPYWICYSSPRSLRNLEAVARRAARVFDEVIIDDFLCTACRCSRCRKMKGDRNWSDFHAELLSNYVDRWLIAPAKEEKPEVRLVIKYPQWYDRFHVFGYDVIHGSRAFDGVWVGTEIRDPRIDYVHQYEAFANYTYLRSLAGEKVNGAWFDFLWCYPEVYMEQAYQSILAGARELTLFSYDPDLYDEGNPMAASLVSRRDLLEAMCRQLDGKIGFGVQAYKPPGSDPGSESFIFDYLGVLGLPAMVTTSRPSKGSILLPMHALADPEVPEHLAAVGPGSVVIATSGFLEGMVGRGDILGLFGLSDDPISRRELLTHRFAVDGREQLSEEAVLLRSYLHPADAEVLAEATGGRRYPILTAKRTNGNTYMSACLDTYRPMPYHGPAKVTVAEPVSLIHLPQALLDSLRALALSPLGLGLRAPARVGVYLYGPKAGRLTDIALENFSDQETSIEVGGLASMELAQGEATVGTTADGFAIRIPRRQPALFSVSS